MRRGVGTLLLLTFLSAGLATAGEPPGRLKTLGLSLLIPGLGHRALGRTDRAIGFMSAEAVFWGAFGVFETQGRLRKESYIKIAEQSGGVPDASGRSDEYYRLVGRYSSSEIYDDEVRRDARARHGDDLDARAAYFEANRMPADQTWDWASSGARQRYREKRSDSNQAYKRAGYMIGVAVANRLLAAVDAMRLIHARDSDTTFLLSIQPDPIDPTEPARLSLTVRFP